MNANVILGVAGSLLTLGLVLELLRRRTLRGRYAVFWIGVAATTLVVAVFPATLFRLAALVGVEVPSNLLFFGASMMLMAISVQHSHELGRLEERTRTLAEELALLRAAVQHDDGNAARVEGDRRPSGLPEDQMHDVAREGQA